MVAAPTPPLPNSLRHLFLLPCYSFSLPLICWPLPSLIPYSCNSYAIHPNTDHCIFTVMARFTLFYRPINNKLINLIDSKNRSPILMYVLLKVPPFFRMKSAGIKGCVEKSSLLANSRVEGYINKEVFVTPHVKGA